MHNVQQLLQVLLGDLNEVGIGSGESLFYGVSMG
jgi:hypothetical protein